MNHKHIIEIGEYQRLLLVQLIKAGAEALKVDLLTQPGYDEIDGPFGLPEKNAYREAVVLFEMLRDIPEDGAPPGEINSFCS